MAVVDVIVGVKMTETKRMILHVTKSSTIMGLSHNYKKTMYTKKRTA